MFPPQGPKDHFAVTLWFSKPELTEGSPWWKGEAVTEERPLCSSRIPAQLPGCTPGAARSQRRWPECGTQEAASQAAHQSTQDSTPDQLGNVG